MNAAAEQEKCTSVQGQFIQDNKSPDELSFSIPQGHSKYLKLELINVQLCSDSQQTGCKSLVVGAGVFVHQQEFPYTFASVK